MYFLISALCFSCGSLIFDVVLKFSTEVAEDDSISLIQNAIVDGKLGELSVSYIIGIPPSFQSITTVPTRTTPKSDGLCQFLVSCILSFKLLFCASCCT